MSPTERNGAIVRLLAETSIHVGIGQSTGAFDLPVARERSTHYPVVPGSGVKGAFRVWAVEQAGLGAKEETLFGKAGGDDDGSDTGAGDLTCSDARLLLLPVRCLSDAYKWVTCPGLLRRLTKDCARVGLALDLPRVTVDDGSYLGGGGTEDTELALEELEFERAGLVDAKIVDVLSGMLARADVEQHLVILSDRDLTWFARYALSVMARNALDEQKIVIPGALWYEETLPAETVMYILLGQRGNAGGFADVVGSLGAARYIQMGGNETVGQGWFAMKEFGGSEAREGSNGGN